MNEVKIENLFKNTEELLKKIVSIVYLNQKTTPFWEWSLVASTGVRTELVNLIIV